MKRILLFTFMFTLVFALFNPPITAKASGIADIKEFDSLTGDAQYLNKSYRDNYSFDIEKVGLLDKGKEMVNEFANILFSIIRTLAYVVASVFYFAMDFDIAKLIKPQLYSIQSALKASIFKPLFTLAFCFTALIIIKKMAKRDTMGMVTEIIKVIGIVVLSTFVVNDSSTALSYCTNITKSVSVSALTGINSDMDVKNTKNFSASAAGILWVSMVHDPWKSMEFNGDVSDDTVKSFLMTKPGSKERKALVKSYIAANPDSDNFNKNRGGERIAFSIIYLIPFLIRSAIYLLVVLIQLVFQVLAIFFFIFAPIVLILAMIPGYENIISIWLKKILETQVSILIVTFVMGLLIKLDSLLYSLSSTYGWFMVIIFQTVIGVGLFIKRDTVLKMFSGIHKGTSNPGYIKSKIMKSGNIYQSLDDRKSNRNRSQTRNQSLYTSSGHNQTSDEGGNKPSVSSGRTNQLAGSKNNTKPSTSTNKPQERNNAPDTDKQDEKQKRPNSTQNSENVVYMRDYKKIRDKNIERKRPESSVEDQKYQQPDQKTPRSQNINSGKTSERPVSNTGDTEYQEEAPKTTRGQNKASGRAIERPESSTGNTEYQEEAPKVTRGQNKASGRNVERPESSTRDTEYQEEAPKVTRGQNKASGRAIERPESSTRDTEYQEEAPKTTRGQNKASGRNVERPESSTGDTEYQDAAPKTTRGQNKALGRAIERPESSTGDTEYQDAAPKTTRGQNKASGRNVERPESSTGDTEYQDAAPKVTRGQNKASGRNVERPESSTGNTEYQEEAPKVTRGQNRASGRNVDRPESSTGNSEYQESHRQQKISRGPSVKTNIEDEEDLPIASSGGYKKGK